MKWAEIPSLAALKAFEAAARLGGYSAAARELNVTHAAIAQHIRSLEREFGQPLMRRAGRGMELTPEGAMLVGPLRDGFSRIAEGVAVLRKEEDNRPLRLSTTPSFAENWLMPRIGDFWAAHPETGLVIEPTNTVVDFRTEKVDMAIRFGTGDWPGLDARFLTNAQDVVVGRQALTGSANRTILVDESYREAVRNFDTLPFDIAGCDIRFLPTHSMALLAARDGLGLAILPRAIAERDIELGVLREIAKDESAGSGYWIVTRDIAPDRVKLLRKWLLSVA